MTLCAWTWFWDAVPLSQAQVGSFRLASPSRPIPGSFESSDHLTKFRHGLQKKLMRQRDFLPVLMALINVSASSRDGAMCFHRGNDRHRREASVANRVRSPLSRAARIILYSVSGEFIQGKAGRRNSRSGRRRIRLATESLISAAMRIFVSRTSLMRSRPWHSGDATLL